MKNDAKIDGLIDNSLKNFSMSSPSLIVDYEDRSDLIKNKKEYN